MKVTTGTGVVGAPNGVSWGLTDAGDPVCAFVVPGLAVRVEMTPEEAKDWGTGAIYIGIDAALRRQAGAPVDAPAPEGMPERASLLVDAAGLPLRVPR